MQAVWPECNGVRGKEEIMVLGQDRTPPWKTRAFLLAVATVVGAAATQSALQLRAWLVARNGIGTVPPIISVDAARAQAPFQLNVPSFIPANGRLDGVRLSEIVLQNREEVEALSRANTKPVFGYGISVRFDKEQKKVIVRAHPGSPAERAGLSTSQDAELLSVNGYRPSAMKDAAYTRRYLMLDQKAKAAAERSNPPLLVRMAAEPLTLILKPPTGEEQTLVLSQREKWIFKPQPWRDPAGKRAALLYTIRGKKLVLHESRSTGKKPPMPKATTKTRIRGAEVWLSGPTETPTAFWQRDGVDYLLNNYQGAANRNEVTRIIESTLEDGGASP